MRISHVLIGPISALLLSQTTYAEGGLAKPNLILKEIVAGLPQGAKNEVRVLAAVFKPGDKTVHHTHDFPITVYVVEGAFTLELKGQPVKTVKAGEAMIEPPNTEMTGYNRSANEDTKVVIFYVSAPETPFLKP
jgi:quercetin dioxygenase-like cupin family protein